jgi:hypothetical protein
VFALPKEQRSPRCNKDFTELDERRFVRSLFPVPIQGGEEFRFGIWVEVALDTFEHVIRVWNDPVAYRTLAFDGRVSNAFVPLEECTLGATVSLATRDATSRPFVVRAADPRLASLLERGWTREQFLAVAAMLSR